MRLRGTALLAMAFMAALAAGGQSLGRKVSGLVDELARSAAAEGSVMSKRGVVVTKLTDASTLAKRHEVGAAVTVLVEKAVADSLVFKLVDRTNAVAYLKEIEFAMSGLAAPSDLQIGAFDAADYFLGGTVTEEGDLFRVTLKLVRTETSRVEKVVEATLPASELAALGDDVAFGYVTANGIGFGGAFSPLAFHVDPDAGGEGQNVMSAALAYRFSKDWKITVNTGFMNRTTYQDRVRTYRDLATTNMAGIQPMIDKPEDYDFLERKTGLYNGNGTQALNYPVYYRINQSSFSSAAIASYVLNFGRDFNLSFGAGPAIGGTRFTQTYDQLPVLVPGRNGNLGVTMTRKDIARDVITAGGQAELKFEWFVLPRIALSAAISGFWMVPIGSPAKEGMTSLSDNEAYYERTDRSAMSFGLNPFMLPDGTVWKDDLFHTLYASAGIGLMFYF